MNNLQFELPEGDYGIFSNLPQKYAESISNAVYYSDAFGVFNELMASMDVVHNLDWTLPDNRDTTIQLSLDYLYPLLKSGKLKMMVPIVSLRTAKTPEEYEFMHKYNIPLTQIKWFIDKYVIYSKPEEADDAVSMVLLQWEKIKRETTSEVDDFYKNLPMIHMKECFYSILLSFTLPDRPFPN